MSCFARNAGDICAGRGPGGVQAGQLAGLRVPIHDEKIAAQSRHHWLCDAENRVRSDGGIHRRSAASQDLRSSLGCQNLAGRCDSLLADDDGTAIVAAEHLSVHERHNEEDDSG